MIASVLSDLRDHIIITVLGVASTIAGTTITVANVVGAQIPDGAVASAVFLILTTITAALAFLARQILDLSKAVARLEERDKTMAEDISELKDSVRRVQAEVRRGS